MYVNYPGRDNYNFDAQDKSFAWLAAQRGIAVDLTEIPEAATTFPISNAPSRPRTCGWAITSSRRLGVEFCFGLPSARTNRGTALVDVHVVNDDV